MNPQGSHDDLDRIINAYKELNKYSDKEALRRKLVSERMETLFDNQMLDSTLHEIDHMDLSKDFHNPRSIRSVVGKMKSMNRAVVIQTDIRISVMKSLIKMYNLK